MSSIFRYPGGKSKNSIKNLILSYAPKFSEYREPFVGGGGIYFSVDPTKRRWINDIDPNLIEVYKALADRPDQFIELCKSIKPAMIGEPLAYPKENSSGQQYNARLKAKFDELSYNEEADQALRYFFINRTVWGVRVNYDPKMKSRMYFSNPGGWDIVNTNKLEKAAKIIKGTRISCGDYSTLLTENGDDVYIFCDPPYYKNTELVGPSRLYGFGFEVEDHAKLAHQIIACKHKVLISYDDHPIIRELYKDFHIYEASWTYCGTSSSDGQKKRIGKELIILNYDIKCSKRNGEKCIVNLFK